MFNEERFFFVDPEFFDVFSFALIKGDPATALRDPYTMVVTETIAQKYFGDEDPIGNTLQWGGNDMTITGIVEETPENSHFHYDFLASLTVAQQAFSPTVLENWGEVLPKFVKVMPRDYRRVLEERQREIEAMQVAD